MASGDGRESDWEPVGFSFLDYPPFRQLANEAAAVGSFRIDWLETPEAHILKADLPGLKREEIKVQTENGRILSISGDRKVQEKKSDKWHRVERTKGYMMRRFRLPENAKMDEVKAQLENGVLTVLIPKIVPKKPEVRTINITSKL